jgi:hypothetical protein
MGKPSAAGSPVVGPGLLWASPTVTPTVPVSTHDYHGQPVQAKMEVSPATDRFEAEADRIADQVVHREPPDRPPPMISSINGGTMSAGLQNKAQRELDKPREDDKETSLTSSKRKESGGKAVQLKAKPTGGNAPDTGHKEEEKATPKPPSAQRMVQRATGPESDADTALKEEDKQKRGTASTASKTERVQKEAVQRDAVSADGGVVPSSAESAISSMQAGGGSPLGSDTRHDMESRIGHDFTGVRIHDSPKAHRTASDLNARAFTIGRDVFFGTGQYRPGATSGRHLLAHELTHTVQQNGGSGSVQSKRIQRNGTAQSDTTTPGSQGDQSAGNSSGTTGTDTDVTAADPKIFSDEVKGTINVDSKTVTLPKLELPEVNGNVKGANISSTTTSKATNAGDITGDGQRNWTMRSPTERTGKRQREIWFERASEEFKSELEKNFPSELTPPSGERTPVFTNPEDQQSTEVFYMRRKARRATSANQMFIGTSTELAQHPEILLPSWNESGTDRTGQRGYQVDHIHELQIGGAHEWDNLWLLQAGANQTSGGKIRAALEKPIDAIRESAKADGFWVTERGGTEPDTKTIKKQWTLKFETIEKVNLGVSASNREFYKKEDIEGGKHLSGLHLMSDKELSETGFRVNPSAQPNEISIFAYRQGGTRFRLRRQGRTNNWRLYNRNMDNFLGGFTSVDITYAYQNDVADGESLGSVVGTPKPTQKGTQYPEASLSLKKDGRLGYNVYFDPDELRRFPRASQFIGLSPMEFTDFGISNNGLFQGHGKISATHGLFPGLEIPFEVIGDRSFINFPLPVENLSLGPVTVDQAALQLGFDSTGIVLGGTADISVARVGSGHLEAIVNRQGVRIEGDFDFETDFLDPASARFVYDMNTNEPSLTLNAGVQEGKLPGVERGEVTATIDRDGFDISGTLYPSGFLAGAEVVVSYTRESGITIELNEYRPPVDNIPAIRDAVVSLGVNKPPDSDDWRLYGIGSAQFALPYTTGGLTIGVNNNIVTIVGTADVERPPASGTLTVTATNQEIDEEGNPVEGRALDEFRVFGRGSASLNFGIITATAGLELTEDGEIIVEGELALPPTFEVFPERRYERELLHVEPPEFPIWGVSVAGVGIGIFAFFDAYLNFDAYVGPGTLNDVALRATYTFSRPDDTVIDGNANFNIPAGAGFTVDIGGGIRARLATAQVSGRIGLAARLGLEANAGADVNLHWTPTEGLSIRAEAYANVSPKFRISANARVTASVDLWLAEPSYTWGPWEQVLGEFGPDMMVEARFPVEWTERDGLDLDLDNIEIKKPEVDYANLMKDAFLELV